MTGGPPPQCSNTGVAEHVKRSSFLLGIGFGSLSSTLRFDGSDKVDIDMNTITLFGSWQLTDKWSIRTGLGFIQDGTMKPHNQSEHNVNKGGMFAIGTNYMILQGKDYNPYLDFSGNLSISSARIENTITRNKTKYLSTDLRLGCRASWDIKGIVFPYLAGRVFGGPVFWKLDNKDVIGTDIHHYQFSLGSGFRIWQIIAFIEWTGVGEKAWSTGFSYAL